MPFSTPLIFCSSGVATEASTSVALAPMNVVVTWTIGGTISGYCAIGSPCIATTPSSTRMIDSTIATIGRLTKKRAMVYFASPAVSALGGAGRRHRLGADGHAVAQRLEPLGDDLFARLEPFFDDPERVDPRTDLHVAERDLAVAADDGDAVQVLQFLHGALRNQERAGLGVEEQPRPPVLAGPQDVVGVRESRAARRACRWCC